MGDQVHELSDGEEEILGSMQPEMSMNNASESVRRGGGGGGGLSFQGMGGGMQSFGQA